MPGRSPSGVQCAVGFRGGHAFPGAGNQNIAVWQGWAGVQDIAHALGDAGAAPDAEGNIRPQLSAQHFQCGGVQRIARKAVQSAQNGGGIGASACQTCRVWDMLFDVYGCLKRHFPASVCPCMGKESLRRAEGKVAPVGRECPVGAGQSDAVFISR